jgi:two-component system chemotaxis response regulator CheY
LLPDNSRPGAYSSSMTSRRTLFSRLLQSAGFDVVVAEGGAAGLQKLREDPGIRLVLLDLNMPEIDG